MICERDRRKRVRMSDGVSREPALILTTLMRARFRVTEIPIGPVTYDK